MTLIRQSWALLVCRRLPLNPYVSVFSRHRKLATVAADPSVLPLAGIRVLDMTRVLAGVRATHLSTPIVSLTDILPQPYCTQILGDLGYATASFSPRAVAGFHQSLN